MSGYIDLHTHSYKSDGSMSPAQVVQEAKRAGLKAMALSDHDTFDGVREAMAEGDRIGIEVVPAVEFSAKCDTQNHIICLYPDIDCPEFTDYLAKLKKGRESRNAETADLLEKLNMPVTLDEVKAIAGSTIIGRAHFAKVMVQKGYVSSVKEAFTLYLGSGCPAFSGLGHPPAEEIIALIKKAGGLSFAAHLNQIKLEDDELKKYLIQLKGYGLDGVEGYYSEYTPEMTVRYQAMAKELGLIISGGSDFHGAMKPHISMGTGFGNLRIPYSVLENIKSKKENTKQ